MKKLYLIINIFILCLFCAQPLYAGYSDDGWTYRGYIDLPTPDTTISDFLLTVPPDMVDANITDYWYGNGSDLRFSSDANGDTPLASYWHSKYNPDFIITVKVPSFTSTTKVYYWCGKEAADFLDDDDTYGKDNVYPSDWRLVYTFDDFKSLPVVYDDGFATPVYNVVKQPAAMYHNGVVYFVWSGDSGDIYINSYTEATGAFGTPVKVITDPLDSNDHDAPTVHIDSDGYIHVFSGSSGCTYYLHYKSNATENISNWTQQTSLPGQHNTYLHTLITNDLTFGAWEDTDAGYQFEFGTLTDNFQSSTVFLEKATNTIIYLGQMDYDAVNDRIWMAWTYYTQGEASGYYDNIYVAYMDMDDYAMYAYDGTSLGASITKTEAESDCVVVDDDTYQVCIPVVSLDNGGNPHILYNHNSAGGWNACHIYFNGTSWGSESTITACGHGQNIPNGYYSDGDLHVYVPVSTGAWCGDLVHYKYDGSSWTKIRTVLETADVTSWGGATGVGIPATVYRGTDNLRWICYAGDMDDMTNSDLPGMCFDSKDNFVYDDVLELNTTTITDSTTNGFDAAVAGLDNIVTGVLSQGIEFDGAETIALDNNILTSATENTIIGWWYSEGDLNNPTYNVQYLYSFLADYGIQGLLTESNYAGGEGAASAIGPYAINTSVNTFFSDAPYSRDEWMHIAGVFDSGDLSVYKNGIFDESNTVGTIKSYTGNSFLGGQQVSPGLIPFYGDVDEFYVIQGTLSADYIEELYGNQNDPENWVDDIGDLVPIGVIPIIQPVIIY